VLMPAAILIAAKIVAARRFVTIVDRFIELFPLSSRREFRCRFCEKE
jgi:hypothetical protein